MSDREVFVMILSKLAIRRQAEVDAATYAIYSEDLDNAGIRISDLESACAELGLKQRDQFSPAFPSVGDILAACRVVVNRKHAAELRAWQDSQPKQITEPLSKEKAAMWLERIKAAAHGMKDVL